MNRMKASLVIGLISIVTLGILYSTQNGNKTRILQMLSSMEEKCKVYQTHTQSNSKLDVDVQEQPAYSAGSNSDTLPHPISEEDSDFSEGVTATKVYYSNSSLLPQQNKVLTKDCICGHTANMAPICGTDGCLQV